MTPPIPTEAQESYAFAEWLRWGRIDFIHVPNEGKRSRIGGHYLVRQGLSKGFPDFLIFTPPPNSQAIGVAIEMKRRKGGRTTPYQLRWLAVLANHGWATCIAKGADDAVRFMGELGYGGRPAV